jgi:hypothetical protein
MNALPSVGQFLICGGADGDGVLLGGCYLLNSTTWSLFMDSGTVLGRGDHVGVVHGNLLVLYGGNVSNGIDPTLPQAFRLDSRTYASDAVVSGPPPPARWGHSGVFLSESSSLLIFGGATEDLYDQSDLSLLTLGDGVTPAFTWSDVPTTGAAPSPRHYHASVAYGSHDMIVSGGTNMAGDAFTDVYRLTYVSGSGYSWVSLLPVRAVPLFGHVSVLVGATLVVYGGHISSSSSGGSVRTLDVGAPNPVWQDTSPAGTWLQTPFRAGGSLASPSDDIQSFQLLVYGGNTIDGYARVPPLTLAQLTQQIVPEERHFNKIPVFFGISLALLALILVALFFAYRYIRAHNAKDDTDDSSSLLRNAITPVRPGGLGPEADDLFDAAPLSDEFDEGPPGDVDESESKLRLSFSYS